MEKIDLDLCRRIERAEAKGLRGGLEHGQHMFPEHGIAVEEVAGATVCYAGDGSPFNQVVGVERELRDSDITAILEFYRARGVPAAVILSPAAGETAERLAERGFERAETESALVADLTVVRGSFGSGIEVCTDPAEWAEHSSVTFAGGYGSDALRFIAYLMASHPTVMPLAIRETGQIISTACVAKEEDGIAGLFADATSPWARGRGLQSALIADRIARARDFGASLARATANAGTSSERNYLRAGFQIAYTRTAWILRE